ncbi:hypothetical protein ACFU6I_05360 [Streptomyces sp. NPDC057486]|uniref:hypothetical protein n=1 Tax=Streptomyces sp. NPDC057486 TaxID=3346145 RepID=UPI0036A01CAE
MHPFFATLYYCGPRPEEAVAMRVKDVALPAPPGADDQWCELLIHTATPEIGKQRTKWLNDGMPPARAADRAGNSVPPVLPATCARCVEGQLPDLKRRLEAAGDLLELPDVG